MRINNIHFSLPKFGESDTKLTMTKINEGHGSCFLLLKISFPEESVVIANSGTIIKESDTFDTSNFCGI